MQLKKLSINNKFVLCMVIIIALLATVIGVSNIFAKPTLENYVHEIGEFEPSGKYNDEENIHLVAWLNTTQLMFSYNLWEDVNKDDVIDANDVYAQEGFEFDTLMTNTIYPIFKTEENANYYVVSFPDYEDYNGVVAQLQISENNDLAQMKDEETYWFDRENGCLYIDRKLIDTAIYEEDFVSIRAEVVMLFEAIDDATREVDIYTLFDGEIEDTMGLEEEVPNEAHDVNIRDWLIGSLQYQLMPSEYLMYASNECLTVFVNGEETYDWYYNAFNGTITIACDPYTTRNVAVKFNEVEDQSDVIKDAQTITTFGNTRGQGGLNTNVFSEDDVNMFLKYIQYDTKGPEIGTTYELDFTAFAYVDNNGDLTNASALYMADGKSIPTDAIEDAIEMNLNESDLIGDYFKAGTISAAYKNYYQENDEIVAAYGNVLDNLFFYRSARDESKLAAAVNVANQDLLSSIDGTGTSTNKALTSVWKSYREDDDGNAMIQGIYIAGTLAADEDGQATDFLGGHVTRASGYAFFDLNCACINAPSAAAYEANAGFAPGAEYKANVTIVDIEENADGGFLYLCVWSESNDPNASQVLLGFSKVPYKYKNLGTVKIYKTDATEDDKTGEFIAGAQYMMYYDEDCQNEVFEEPFYTYIENTGDEKVCYYESPELNIGTYYIKEVGSVPGYAKDTTKHVVKIESGVAQILNITTHHQKYTLTVRVRDAMTATPLEGILFKLYDPGDMLVGTYETDENGLLGDGQISVNAVTVDVDGVLNSTYILRQVTTMENYAIDDDYVIEIDAEPTTEGDINRGEQVYNVYRQEVVITSHVQDEKLGEDTTAIVGGSYEGSVVMAGAQYQLFPQKPITLSDGTVLSESDGPLTILTWGEDGNEEYTDVAYAKWDQNDDKAYIMASGIEFDDSEFPLPNGEYYWKLVHPSAGYYNDHSTKYIDATWDEANTQKVIDVDYAAVTQKRQTVSINAYVKSYAGDKPITVPAMKTNLRDGAISRVIPVYEVNGTSKWNNFADSSVKKTVWSSGTNVNGDTTETATLTVNNNRYKVDEYEVVASKAVEGAVYELIALCDIVDVNTCEEIKAGSVIGSYESKSDGGFDLPELPNGVYALTIVTAPEDYRAEVGLSEDIIIDTEWHEEPESGNVPKHIEVDSVVMLYKDGVGSKNLQKIQIAPDPKETDSSKITTEWVEKNMYNRAYRVVDINNKSADGSVYDVSDQLPTNFALCLNNKLIVESQENFADGSYEYQYLLSFYYEVNDYDKDNGYDVKLSDGTCLRKFKTAALSGEELLSDIITLDANSLGYKNHGAEIVENKIILGSIHNAEWINKKLADNTYGGKYNIYVFVDISLTYETKGTGQRVTVDLGQDYDMLTIKGRQLINLD